MHNPVPRLKGIVSLLGVVTSHSPWVWVDKTYPLASSIGMEMRVEFPFSFSYTLRSPYDLFLLLAIVPILHLPVIVALLSSILDNNSLMKNVWYDMQLSR